MELILTEYLRGQTQNPICGFSADGSRPGMTSNSKFTMSAARNTNNESIATASPKHTLGPV